MWKVTRYVTMCTTSNFLLRVQKLLVDPTCALENGHHSFLHMSKGRQSLNLTTYFHPQRKRIWEMAVFAQIHFTFSDMLVLSALFNEALSCYYYTAWKWACSLCNAQ